MTSRRIPDALSSLTAVTLTAISGAGWPGVWGGALRLP